MVQFIFLLFFFSTSWELKFGIYSDIHYDIFYTPFSDGNKCHKQSKSHKIQKTYGKIGCDSPYELVSESINSMKRLMDGADAYIFLGDFVGHYQKISPSEKFNQQKYEKIKETIANVTKLSINTLQSKIFFCFGNNDNLYDYQAPSIQIKKDFYSFLYQKWFIENPYMKEFSTDENYKSFMNGGYYSANIGINNTFKIIVLNTMYFGIRSNTDLSVANDQLNWIENQLNQALINKQKVIFTMHLPPGKYLTNKIKDSFWNPTFEDLYFKLLHKYNSIIYLSLAGHIHLSYYHFDIANFPSKNFGKNEKYLINNIYISKSISPNHYNYPGFQSLIYNEETTFSKIDEYVLNLVDANNKVPHELWTRLYSSDKQLRMNDLSANSFKKFKDRRNLNPFLMAEWIKYKLGYFALLPFDPFNFFNYSE